MAPTPVAVADEHLAQVRYDAGLGQGDRTIESSELGWLGPGGLDDVEAEPTGTPCGP